MTDLPDLNAIFNRRGHDGPCGLPLHPDTSDVQMLRYHAYLDNREVLIEVDPIDETATIATRDHSWQTWGPPEPMRVIE